MKSAKVAGLLQERADGRVQLRREPGSMEEEPMGTTETTERTIQRTPLPRVLTVSREEIEVERFPIPLASEGKSAMIELPKGWTTADVRKMIHVIEAMFLWEADRGGQQEA